ncbi:MAG TPA: hypothetical protein VGK73_37700 [Polyangiaceae bacterium]
MKPSIGGALALSAALLWHLDASADCARQYFVYGEQAVYLADRVQIGRGPVGARQSAELGVGTRMQGDLVAPRITLRNNAILNGTAYATNPITLGAGAKILIKTAPIGAEQNCTSPAVPTVNPGTGSNVIDEPFELPPGRYGSIQVVAGGTLVVTTGEYHFQSLKFESDSSLVVMWQGGPAKLLARDLVTFGDRHEQTIVGGRGNDTPNAVEVLSRQTALLRLGTDARILSRILAPFAEVSVPSRTTVYAPLYGKVVRVDPDSVIGQPVASTPNVCL